jgi:thiamine biosynthesis protein ThiC
VVPIAPETVSVAELLTAADSACAAAKEAGRNRVQTWQENDIDLMRRRREMQWAARINNALEDRASSCSGSRSCRCRASRPARITSCCCACGTNRARSLRRTCSSMPRNATA